FQSLIGPLFIHLLTREMFASQFAAPPIEVVITHIVTTFLDGALVRPAGGSEGGIAHDRDG
ncbi:MAG: hypothetical protein LC748_06615, partial [Thermomicrobia bacterium]|nr:hypothetical protein [Thermomicrobia bacterium]